ncbi:MAG: hypothetical protein ACK5DE_10190 [Bacteroidota bacterium]|jgi:hypothetical protein
MSSRKINLTGLSLEDRLVLPFRLKLEGVYQSFTGQSLNAEIWDADTETTLLTISTAGGGITFSTNTVTNDTVTCTFTAAQIATLSAGTYRIRVYWTTNEMTLISGKLNFVKGAP